MKKTFKNHINLGNEMVITSIHVAVHTILIFCHQTLMQLTDKKIANNRRQEKHINLARSNS